MTSERTKAMDKLIAQDADLIDKLRDEDSYYRLQEKHWCIDSEELERQRLAAADLIETQAREIERLRTAGDQMLTAFAEGTNWTPEKRAAYEAMSAALAGDSHD